MFTIKDMSIRELLAARNLVSYGGAWWCKEPGETVIVGTRLAKGGVEERVYATADEIRAELATRPHINRRGEGKLIRKLKAQTGRSEESLHKDPKYGPLIYEAANNLSPRKEVSATEYRKWVKIYGAHYMNRHYIIKKGMRK